MDAYKRKLLIKSRRLFLAENLSEKEVIHIIGISETGFRNLYKYYFGKAPSAYIRYVKMKKAKTLLRITSTSISELAGELGYANVSKFAQAFKKQYGVSPSEYRKICKDDVLE